MSVEKITPKAKCARHPPTVRHAQAKVAVEVIFPPRTTTAIIRRFKRSII